MTRSGRPLYFLGAVVGSWVGVRAFMLWPVAERIVPALVDAVAPPAMAEAGATVPHVRDRPGARRSTKAMWVLKLGAVPHKGDRVPQVRTGSVPTSFTIAPSPPEVVRFTLPPDPLPPGVDPPPAFRTSRWSGSAWAIFRPEGRATPFASQLGGSQAGVRLAYAVDEGRRVAVYARGSGAIDARQREGAVGVDWRPTRLPVHLVAERRIGIEGVRGGTAVGVVGGVGPTPVMGPVRVEGYAQGGVIFRDGREGFADGSVRLTVPVVTRIDLGLGAWGGAQRGAARVDVGPTLGVVLPVASRSLRLSADWRQRIIGDARPGSGPAVSLGMDF